MRPLSLFAAVALAAAPVLAAPSVAYADGIERPRQPRRARPRSEPVVTPPPAPVIEHAGPETVTLSNDFFAAASGGVGASIDGGSYAPTIVIVRGGRSSASAFASAHASARVGAFGGGGCRCR